MAKPRHIPNPEIGEWYLDRESAQEFEIIDLDEDAGLIEVQYLNGEIGEFDVEEWSELALSKIEPPEDWNAALEPVEEGDAAYDPEQPVRRRPAQGFEPDEVLRADEDASRDQVVSGSQAEEE
ncbi:MAG TPA: DUF6763 family protein [Gammaproteobacteria bacterium]|nr:DUF6763 family protein [Gammaproteobacteria bacterium]